MKAQQAQSSFEFLMMVGVAFTAALVFLLASLDDIKDLSQRKEYFLIKEQGDRIGQEIALAVQVEDGYRRSFPVPEQLDSRDYSIVMANSTLTLTSEHATYFLRVPSVEGSIAKGMNNVTKEGGVVRIN